MTEFKINNFDAKDFCTSSNESDLLGRGSFASVRRCYHPKLGKVAVKYIRLIGSSKSVKSQRNSLEKETKVLSRLSHKNVIRCFGTTKWNNYFGLILEEASNNNLEDLLVHEKDKDIPWPLRLRFFDDIAEGLSYLHYHDSKQAFIHGDLKPQNILLDKNLTSKIADFGAVDVFRATTQSVATSEFEFSKQYTVLYSAPEVLKEPFSIKKTKAMDVYSYAMIGYEIITRQQVFSANTIPLTLIIELIKNTGLKPDKTLMIESSAVLNDKNDILISKILIETVQECWKTNPQERPSIRNTKNYFKTVDLNSNCSIDHLTKLKKVHFSKTISLANLESGFQTTNSTSQLSTNLLNPSSSSNGISNHFDDSSDKKWVRNYIFAYVNFTLKIISPCHAKANYFSVIIVDIFT